MINNKIHETNTSLQIISLFKKICFHIAFKILHIVKVRYFTRQVVPELWGRITECSTTKCWQHLAAWSLKHNFFAGSEGKSCELLLSMIVLSFRAISATDFRRYFCLCRPYLLSFSSNTFWSLRCSHRKQVYIVSTFEGVIA